MSESVIRKSEEPLEDNFKFNLELGLDVPIPTLPADVMRSLSDPAVSNVTVSLSGNLIVVFVFPVCLILSVISKEELKDPELAVTPPTNYVAVIIPVAFTFVHSYPVE